MIQLNWYQIFGQSIPDGRTVTPTDDIQIWLHCGNIWDKNYTTLAQVLADTDTLVALMASDNAVDYLVRSTSWATGLTASETAMQAVGASDYASETLMADATWCAAITDSSYADYVSNVKVPTMTSNNTPSGVCSATSETSATYAAWRAFDGNSSSMWSGGGHSSFYLRYTFTNSIKVYCAKHIWFYSTAPSISYKIQGLNSGVVEYESENKTSLVISPNENTVYISNPSACESWQIYVNSIAYGGYTDGGRINKLQFYGRQNGGVQTWLHAAGITNKNYTTLSEVLADTSTLSTLINNHSACDYLVTCKGWATTICADSNAMTYIGQNNYCANTLLADSTWRTAICNSTYFESVLNVKVPIMTDNTHPSGVASATSTSSPFLAYMAFDGVVDNSYLWVSSSGSITNQRIQYKFDNAVKIFMAIESYTNAQPTCHPKNIKYQCSSDNVTWTDKASETWSQPTAFGEHKTIFASPETAEYWGLLAVNNWGNEYYIWIHELQFYGREDV